MPIPITFSITATGGITDVSAGGELSGVTVTMRDSINSLLIYKIDAVTEEKLAGAEFALYEYSQSAADHHGARVFENLSIITDENGEYTLYGLTNGADLCA